MNGSQFWELYQSYGDVYRQEVLNEEYVEIEEAKGEGPESATPGTRLFQQLFRGAKKIKGSKRTRQDTSSFQGKGSKAIRRAVNSSYDYDLYDVVLEHLLDEGYAETSEDATVLMANMSEQWFEAIVEEMSEEMARLRLQMRTALQKGDKETVQKISSRLAEIQPKAQSKIGAEQRGLNRRKR